MVSHVVLMKPRPNLSPDDRNKLIAAFWRALADIPAIRGVRVGRRITHGAGYEAGMPDTGDYLVVLQFDDVEGLNAYLHHPAHAAVGRGFAELLSSALVYDFEEVPLEDLRQ